MQAYHGGEGGDGSEMEGVNVAICTIEKANSIVNRLAEEKRLQVRTAVSPAAVGVCVLTCSSWLAADLAKATVSP